MQMLLGFSPILLFVIVSNVSISLALWISFAAAFAVGIRTFLQKREIRILDAGNIVLFGGMTLLTAVAQVKNEAIMLTIHAGLLPHQPVRGQDVLDERLVGEELALLVDLLRPMRR